MRDSKALGISDRQSRALAEFCAAFGLHPDTQFIPVAGELLDSDLQPATLVEVQQGPYPFVGLVLTRSATEGRPVVGTPRRWTLTLDDLVAFAQRGWHYPLEDDEQTREQIVAAVDELTLSATEEGDDVR